MSVFGKALPISIFGESHGEVIGLTIHQMPAGITLDFNRIDHELTKRRPSSVYSTARQEPDPYRVVSGYFNNKTTGAPLTFLIENKDTISRHYQPHLLRPSTSDYTAHIKYKGFNDYRGSGHFSGRLTALISILGAISMQLLEAKDIYTASHILQVKDIKDKPFQNITKETLQTLLKENVPLLKPYMQKDMEEVILDAKNHLDSVGGLIETAIINVPAGIGNPMFEKVNAVISHLISSIPSVKGIIFGDGLQMIEALGSEMNDAFQVKDQKITTTSNHSGGIQGGITNGMPICFKTIIKPTASIAQVQDTINIQTMENERHIIKGRHDPAIVYRAVHVVNQMAAYAILECLLRENAYETIR